MTEEQLNGECSTAGLSKELKERTKKLPKKGIIYLSTIPPYMNVTKIRETFGQYGTVGRVYLQLTDTEPRPGEKKSKRRNVAKKFTEGWVEFERKSTAKKVAILLNNHQVSTRKKSKNYDCIWNIKYLTNFKWTHLNERLAYEKIARRHKLRNEVQLAKKKSNFFTLNLEKNKNKAIINREYENLKVKKDVSKTDDMETDNLVNRKDFLKSVFS